MAIYGTFDAHIICIDLHLLWIYVIDENTICLTVCNFQLTFGITNQVFQISNFSLLYQSDDIAKTVMLNHVNFH